MEKVQEFRQRAAECREHSGKSPTSEIREYYLELAKMWDKLADERSDFFVHKDQDKAG